MNPIASNATAAQVYGGNQSRGGSDVGKVNRVTARPENKLPQNATPQGEWVLRADANPQNFDNNAPRGTYLNLVV